MFKGCHYWLGQVLVIDPLFTLFVLFVQKEATEHINLKVLGQDGQVVHFKIKQHTSLKKLISAYCARSKLAQATVRFRFDGQPISENDTPRGLDMEDGDTIEVFQQQTGGHQTMFLAGSALFNHGHHTHTTEKQHQQHHHTNGQNIFSADNSGLSCPQHNTSSRHLTASPLIHSNENCFQTSLTALHTNTFIAESRSFYSDSGISYKWFSSSCAVTEATLLYSHVNTLPCERLGLIL